MKSLFECDNFSCIKLNLVLFDLHNVIVMNMKYYP